jgi:hypothetical protein
MDFQKTNDPEQTCRRSGLKPVFAPTCGVLYTTETGQGRAKS